MCKKLFFVLAATLAAWISGNAQTIFSYDFVSSQGTWTEITDGTKMNWTTEATEFDDSFDNTVWIGSLDGMQDDENEITAAGFDIGFDFVYNGQKMNKFAITSHGTIVLGKDEISVMPWRSRFFFIDNGGDDASGVENAIGAAVNASVAGRSTTEVSYKLIGTAPNRTLVVQYKDLGMAVNYSASRYASVDYQIRLNETTNTVDMVFNGWLDEIEDNSHWVRVGIKGNNNDLHMRYYDGDCNWQSTIKSSEDASDDMMLKWNKDCGLTDGLTFTFTPCADCATPATQPTDLIVAPTSDTMSGRFTATEGADHYLVVLYPTAPTAADVPVDGTYYAAGDALGAGTVVAYTSGTEFSTVDENDMQVVTMESGKDYYVTVYAANSFCMYAPKYNTVSALQTSIKTLPAAPATLDVTGVGTDYIEVNATANAEGHDVVILYTDVPKGSDNVSWAYLGQGVFGELSGEVAAGDEIEGGGKVLYAGPAGTAVKAEGLTPNRTYFFGAYSRNAEGKYSSLGTFADCITNGTLPYTMNLEEMWHGVECGRESSGVGQFMYADNTIYMGPAKPANTEYYVTTQYIVPAVGTNRVKFDMSMYIWGRFGSTAHTWAEGEELLLETSTDGETWTTVSKIDSTNAPVWASYDEYVSRNMTWESADQTPVKLRLRWVVLTNNVRFYLRNFKVEEKKACDYPVNVKVTELATGKATINWESQGTETQWVVNWRAENQGIWYEAVTDSKSYTITDLHSRTDMVVRVAAKCSAESQSDWSDELRFKSAYSLPLAETFTGGEADLTDWWGFKEGELGESNTEFSDDTYWSYYNTSRMKAVLFEGSTPCNSWVLLPTLNFDEEDVNYELKVTLYTISAGENNDETLKVVASYDGGTTFNTAGVIHTIEHADMPAEGEMPEYVISLKGLKGDVRLGLLLSGTTGTPATMQLARVVVEESCKNDVWVRPADVAGTYFTATWEGTKDEDQQWMYFIRKQGETTKDYQYTSEYSMKFEGLETRTTYEVGVTKACAVDDVARPYILAVTTLSDDPCLPLEEVTATADVFGFTLNWEGDAYAYNIRYRYIFDSEWTDVKNVQGNSYTVEGLNPATTYYYQVQTVCSQADGDISDWTETGSVFTLIETCFAPEDITIDAAHNRAVISWTGDAAAYEVEYRLDTESEWNAVMVEGATSLELTELTPESSYQVRLRSLCEDGQTSRYSDIKAFSTTAIPECVVPSNLRVENISETGATLLWDADESNLTWDVNWRATAVTEWTEVLALTETSLTLSELEQNTAYTWRVKASCDEGRESGWSAQNKFTTLQSGIDAVSVSDLTVYASGSILNILNPQNVAIDSVAVYSGDGALKGAYEINSSENVMIPTTISGEVAFISVKVGVQTLTFKVVFK